jgi:glutamine synthetase
LDNVAKIKNVFDAAKAKTLASQDISLIEEISERVNIIKSTVDKMVEARKVANKIENERDKAVAYANKIFPFFDEIRYHIDKLELIVDNEMWTLPKYRELLFIR